MKKKFCILLSILIFVFTISVTGVFASSYLADKAETPIALNNTGSRSICQTEDGFVWIGQFAGLNRYDSKDLVSYNSFIDDEGNTVQIENVRKLASYRNDLYMVSSVGLLKLSNGKFSKINLSEQNLTINDLKMDDSGLLYISTTTGLFKYNTETEVLSKDESHHEDVLSVEIYLDKFFIIKENNALYDYENNLIYDSEPVNTIYSFEKKLAIATNQGKILFYDIENNQMLSKSIVLYDVAKNRDDMVHKFVYSSDSKNLFAACEKGLYSIDVDTLEATYAQKLENSSKLVDIMIDYEKNLWIASYISGVSIISQSSLVDLLFDVSTTAMPEGRLVYAILKYNKDLYLATGNGIFVYDLETNTINSNHPLITKINEIVNYDEQEKNKIVDLSKKQVGFANNYSDLIARNIVFSNDEHTVLQNGDVIFVVDDSTDGNIGYYEYQESGDSFKPLYSVSKSNVILKETKSENVLKNVTCSYDVRIPYNDIRDIEVYKDKIYFATYGSGLFEYDPVLETFNFYRGTDINPDDPTVNTKGYYAVAQRCLRAIDDYLFIGTASNSIIRFDGTNFIFNRNITTENQTPCVNGQVLYINKSGFGDITYVMSGYGIHTIDKDLTSSSIKAINGIEETTSGMLKFYQDGDYFFYNIYGRFFVINTKEKSNPKEINIPFVNSSITEINKVKLTDDSGNSSYKYVVASEKQIYIIEDLLADELNYEFYDSSNGLKSSIKANSSGCYDEESNTYYLQSQDGVFVYNFVNKDETRVPLKISVNSVTVDDKLYDTNSLKLDKNSDRVTFNLSIFSFKPTKGYSIYYKLDGVDSDYVKANDGVTSVSYTNLSGGNYKFHVYVMDELNQQSNVIEISLTKDMHIYEQPFFWIFIISVGVALVCGINFGLIYSREKKAEEREKELKEITLESIEAIARTIDAKDTYTNGHSIRVGHYSRIIAEALGMQGDELENLYYIALLHDIGKIGIPDAILNKPGRLTDEEFAVMKSHTTKGAKILKDISTIPNIVEGAKYHHEKYGGGGYPEGLKGEDIPYIARIICCADCFDAMATKRVYKDPYPKEKIISEFERCKEIQFDPNIADVVIKLIEEGKLKAELEEDLNERLNKVEEIKKANS